MGFRLPSVPCSGCGACVSHCPAGALSLKSDNEGFLTPVLENGLCTDCDLCINLCPAEKGNGLPRAEEPSCYACWNKDDGIRNKSASGGMFSVYADQILSEGGVVYGTAWRDPMEAPEITRAESSEELAQLRSSKYVQAVPGRAYEEIAETLNEGRKVLFTGTPCQVAGLYAVLGGDHPLLYTCDLVCHGVPSPALYRKWTAWLAERYGGRIRSMNMRGKSGSESHFIQIETENAPDRTYQFLWNTSEGVYLNGFFLKNLSLRKSCHSCRYASIPRVGDITLGDFWGLGTQIPFSYDTERGISLNLINTEKGRMLADASADRAVYVSRPLQEALANVSLRVPVPPHPARSSFLRDTAVLTFPQLIRKYRYVFRPSFRKQVRRFLKKLISKLVRKRRRELM